MFEPGIAVYVHADTRVAAWRNSGDVCVPAWKSSLGSRGYSCGSLEKQRGNSCSSLVKQRRNLCSSLESSHFHEETRVVAWIIIGDVCVRAWKSSLCSRVNSRGSLEK